MMSDNNDNDSNPFGDVGTGADSDSDNDAGDNPFGSIGTPGSSGGNKSKSGSKKGPGEIRVEGRYGTKLYRKGDSPDIGSDGTYAVLKFSGVVEHEGETLIGPISVGKDSYQDIKSEFEEKLGSVEVVRL